MALSYQASTNILPAIFVSMTGERTVGPCTVSTGFAPVGISQPYDKLAPGTPWDTGYAAGAGDSLQVYGDGEVCMMQLSATVTAGAELMTDGVAGYGITCTAGNWFGAIAQENGISGQRIKVQVQKGYKGN